MAISSVTSSVPVTPPQPVALQTPPVKNDGDGDANDAANAANAYQPPPPAPLPPGQGTRIDQLA